MVQVAKSSSKMEPVAKSKEDAAPVAKIKKSATKRMPRKSKKIRDDRPFPFLKLPAELRNRIYDLALTSPKRILLTSSVRKHIRRHLAYRIRSKKLKEDKELLTPNILRVNRQIYHEALPVLYNQPLEFEDSSALFYFLSQIGNDGILSVRCIKITSISVGTKGLTTQPAFTALINAINLDMFTVGHLTTQSTSRRHSYTYTSNHRPMHAKWLFEAAHVWIEHLEKNKAKGGKDWRDVIVLDEAAKSMTFKQTNWTGSSFEVNYLTPCTMEKFCADMEKALKPEFPPLKANKRENVWGRM